MYTVDNMPEMENTAPEKSNKLLTRRNIFIVFGLIIALEVIWGGWTLFRPGFQFGKQPAEQRPTVLAFVPFKNSLKVGEKVTVGINLTSGKRVDGVDLIVNYDPKLLSVEATGSAQPLRVNKLFNDYPQNVMDTNLGKITVSGITSQPVIPNGLFGSIIFVGKAPGTAKISFDHTVGSTTDSNVIENKTGNDILEKVENLELTIIP